MKGLFGKNCMSDWLIWVFLFFIVFGFGKCGSLLNIGNNCCRDNCCCRRRRHHHHHHHHRCCCCCRKPKNDCCCPPPKNDCCCQSKNECGCGGFNLGSLFSGNCSFIIIIILFLLFCNDSKGQNTSSTCIDVVDPEID